MFVKKKKNKSGTTSVIVVSKHNGTIKRHCTVGIGKEPSEIEDLVLKGKIWIDKYYQEHFPRLDLFGEERKLREAELSETARVISEISNVFINGTELILNRVFDRIGFNKVNDPIFRQLVLSRLAFPSSKAATVEYLKNHFDRDVDLSKIYRYLDKLNDSEQENVQNISVEHTRQLFSGTVGVVFYDVTTLYFEIDSEDELRKQGFSKEGRHRNPQIILGLLVSVDGYPLAYCIHPGNKYEGYTMLPVVEGFVAKYSLENFVVVADSGLMNSANIRELERLGYKYVIGAKIKSEKEEVRQEILSHPKIDSRMFEIDKGGGCRLLVGYTDKRGRKDAYNREKGVRKLEKAYKRGTLTKENINKRGYNKFLQISSNVNVEIDYEKIIEDARWDGLKGYLTNTSLPPEDVYNAYHNLWNVERAFRIAKSKIKIRPMFHFTERRIKAHICICFVALKVYKELERLLKQAGIGLSVDKVLAMAKTIVTIEINLPQNNSTISKTLIMKRHKPIEKLFDENFWGTQ